MLVLARHPGETIIVELGADVDPATPIGEVFVEPMEIGVSRVIGKHQVRIAIDVPAKLNIARSELVEGLDSPH